MSLNKADLLKNKRKRIRLFLSMPTGWVSIILLVIAVGKLVASYFLQAAGWPWLSRVFVSCASGLITGFVLFALTNLRANKSIEIKSEYERMKAVFD